MLHFHCLSVPFLEFLDVRTANERRIFDDLANGGVDVALDGLVLQVKVDELHLVCLFRVKNVFVIPS